MVVPTLVNFVNGCCVDWGKLGLDANGLVDGAGGGSSVDLDGLFSVGLSPFAQGEWHTAGGNAAPK